MPQHWQHTGIILELCTLLDLVLGMILTCNHGRKHWWQWGMLRLHSWAPTLRDPDAIDLTWGLESYTFNSFYYEKGNMNSKGILKEKLSKSWQLRIIIKKGKELKLRIKLFFTFLRRNIPWISYDLFSPSLTFIKCEMRVFTWLSLLLAFNNSA